MLKSRLCTQEQLETATHMEWCARIREEPRLHRKQWEFCYIAQALHERGLLAPGRRGLGFGVGQEPLPALFASFGCEIVATDQERTAAQKSGWVTSGQYTDNLTELNAHGICAADAFGRLVTFRVVDMNVIAEDLKEFDFVWSSCAFEHLGSLDAGLRFVKRAMECLRPGGVAVHTTEFNLSSGTNTLTAGGTVLYRKCDIEGLMAQLTASAHELALDFDPGNGLADNYVDQPPYQTEPHLKLKIGNFVSTSIGLIISKSAHGHQEREIISQSERRRSLIPPIPIPGEWYDQDYFENGLKSNWGQGYSWTIFSSLFKETAEFMTEFFAEAESFLDIGCAKGFLVRALRETGRESFGFDHSRWAIDRADESAKPFLRLAGVDEVSFDRQFDVLLAFSILESLTEEQVHRFLSRARGWTRQAIFATITTLTEPAECSSMNSCDRDLSHITMRSREWWQEAFLHAGWRQDHTHRIAQQFCQNHPLILKMGWQVYLFASH